MFSSNFDLHMDGIDDNMAEQPSNDTEIKLSCRTICIGSYSYKPHSKVRISSEGVTIVAPGLRRRANDDIILHIPLKSFVHVLARAEERPAILLYTEAKTGEYVRSALDMHLESGTYFEPSSTVDEHKRITLVPRLLTRRCVTALRSLFGMVLDELGEPDARRLGGARGSSERDSDPRDQLSPKAAPRTDPPSRSETPINVKGNASTSEDDVIFPPSPTPISISSHSSTPTTPKSSPSSKKRKNRKKNKSNKKMKYVLVKNPEPHAVDAFLAGVAPILKSLSPVFLNLAKSEIISAALKYERKMLTENCNGVSEK
ncbi:uncharacterized protein LOC133532980 [Cydia pomonella]|uniref:uncharacterized protein LOC133532980 n=1 Tax=Cydia pomonella TaxID=82600 RepID=UPI002ADDCE98|nr:uncharacterized protein LOC133532980 [Cydia pomonella]